MFIRLKKIKGNDYGYVVHNSWTDKGARQKVAKYLGKVHKPEKARSKGLKELLGIEDIEAYMGSKSYMELIDDIIRLELHNHKADDAFFMAGHELKTLMGKSAIIQANQGFICSETIKPLKEYRADEDDGTLLANLITAAGIGIEKELFVMLFEKAKEETTQTAEKQQQQQQPKGEFYY